jgi:uncharacterized membrane protein
MDAKELALVLLIMGVLDYIWLGILQADYITEKIRDLNRTSEIPHPPLTFVAVYLLMAGALWYFVLSNRGKKDKTTLIMEALFLGLAIYTTFDFSMLNLVVKWTMYDAIKDIMWGTFMFGLTAFIYLTVMDTMKKSS